MKKVKNGIEFLHPLMSKEALVGIKIRFQYDFSNLRFLIDKVNKEHIWFVNIKTGARHQQSLSAFESTRFVKI